MSIFQRFKRTWNDGKDGFGSESYAAARAAGYSNADIQSGTAGFRVGKRATDMIGAGLSAEQSSSSAAREAQANADRYKSQLDGYQSRIQGYESQIGDYRSQVNNLSNQYNEQLKATETAQGLASEFEDKLDKRTAEYETAKGEADRYRNEAVGNQLRSLRAGSTASSKQSVAGAGSDLASGSTRFAGDPASQEDRLSRLVKSEGGLTDSVLVRKGPVVERMSSGGVGSSSRVRPQNSGLARGAGTGSYYASRFG